jgi:glutamate dehydrogenase
MSDKPDGDRGQRHVQRSPQRRPTQPAATPADRLAAIAAAAPESNLPPELDRGAFFKRYYAQSEAEDLTRDPAALAAAAWGHLRFAQRRPAATPLIRAFNPTLERDGWTSDHTIVETVNDDMPFLVDSATNALRAMGHEIHVTTHPIFHVVRSATAGELESVSVERGEGRKPESFIHFEIVRETDPDILAAVERRLHSVLSDVRAAVDDWPRMRDRLRNATEALRARGDAAEATAFLEWLRADNFTLLGYRELALVHGDDHDVLHPVDGTGLGLLRDQRAPGDSVKSCDR